MTNKLNLAALTIDALEPQGKPYTIHDTRQPGLYLQVSPGGTVTFYVGCRRTGGGPAKMKLGKAIKHRSDEVEYDDGAVLHQHCSGAYGSQLAAQQRKKGATATPAKGDVIITTVPTVANREIDYEISVITSECAYGMNIFRDFFAGVRDFVGGRSGSMQKVLRGAREDCIAALKEEAKQLGADAVIGVDLDYSEFSGGGKGMLFLVASGTAVKLKEAA